MIRILEKINLDYKFSDDSVVCVKQINSLIDDCSIVIITTHKMPLSFDVFGDKAISVRVNVRDEDFSVLMFECDEDYVIKIECPFGKYPHVKSVVIREGEWGNGYKFQ